MKTVERQAIVERDDAIDAAFDLLNLAMSDEELAAHLDGTTVQATEMLITREDDRETKEYAFRVTRGCRELNTEIAEPEQVLVSA